MNLRTFTALAVVLALPAAAAAQAPEFQNPETVIHDITAPAEDSVWPFAASDLPVDPQYRFGVLANGMRYIIRPNSTPPGQAMVQFWVDGGSVSETADEQGFAHFIEHMAFNGTTNVPEGEMVKLLEREGLAFGADTNASTGFDTTLYKLDLPRNDLDLLDTALMLMRETASELSFSEEAVEREKGVILSERRVRDTYALRNLVDNLQFLFPDARFPQRLPIGTIPTLQGADAAKLRALYQRYYRPRNSAIIVIGDFDPAAVEQMVKDRFADWQDQSRETLPDFGPVDLDYAGQTDIFVDPALDERVTVTRHGAFITPPDTAETRRQRVLREIGYGIVNRRLQRLSRLDDPPFRGAALGTDDVFRFARSTDLVVAANTGEWQRGLAAAQEEYRRAMEFGFSEAEVAEQVANLRSSIETNAAGAATRDNSTFVTGALTLLRDGQVPTTPQTALERFEAFEADITPAAVLDALKAELVPLDNPLIRFQGPAAPEGGADALRAAWDAGMAGAIAANEDASLTEFGYSDFGPAGAIATDRTEETLGIREIRFANGLMLNLKPTELEDDRISVQLSVDGGELLNTRDAPLATAMTGALASGGLGKHPFDELVSILAGKRVGFAIQDGDDSFRMGATTTPRDLELQLQLMAASLSDPGFRPTGEAQYRQSVDAFFNRKDATAESALGNALGAIASDDDPRFSLQQRQDYMALTMAALRDAIGDRLANGAVELALVGDFDEQAAIDMVARTLGALPVRESEFRDYAANRQRSFTQDRSARTIYHDGAADQAILLMQWPTRDDSDQRANLTLELLEAVMEIRLLDTLREELGQTYSPSVSASQSQVYPGYGTFTMQAAIDTAQVGATRDAMLETLASMRGGPVDADVLQRARQPMLERFDNALKTNSGWMQLVDRAQTEPERIARFNQGKALLASLSAQDLLDAAKLYLDPAARLEVTVLPRPANDN